MTGAAATDNGTWFGQPKGLTVLFLTNMWETFSYYGMRAMLVYYMTKQLLLGQEHASFVYGLYTACAYFTPILGGMIADRWLGKKKAVIIGATVMAVGHFMMAFETSFYPALATIAIGNGLFLPTLPSQINDLYKAGDERRGWAYNVYYVGVNIGGFLAPLICGTLGELYGWHYGFGTAGVGMLAGLVIYLVGQKHLPAQEVVAAKVETTAPTSPKTMFLALFLVGLSVTIFRGAYEQIGNTVALWADSGIDRHLGDLVIPMTWFQSLNPLLVMIMTPFLLAYWKRRADRGFHSSPARRMSAGAAIVGGAYLILALADFLSGGTLAGWPWLAFFFLVLTVGELFILPTGLGLFAKLAPPKHGATTVAAWFLATFAGSLTAGLVGTLWSLVPHGTFFVMLAGIAGIAAISLRALDNLVEATSSQTEIVPE